MESFEERRSRWERAIESVLVEMTQEKDCNDLAISAFDSVEIVNGFQSAINNIEFIRNQSKNNRGTAMLVPGNRLNEE